MKNKKVNVKCSPGTFEKVKNLQYRQFVAEEAMLMGEYNKVIVTPNDPDGTMETEVKRDLLQATTWTPNELAMIFQRHPAPAMTPKAYWMCHK